MRGAVVWGCSDECSRAFELGIKIGANPPTRTRSLNLMVCYLSASLTGRLSLSIP